MSSSKSKALITGFIFTGLSIFTLLTQATPSSGQWAPGRVLVQPLAGVGATHFEEIINHVGGRQTGKLPELNIHIIDVPPNAEDAVVAALSHNKHINFAEKDFLLGLEETTANDTYFDNAWHLPKIGAPAAWDQSLGDGIIVAVLDTGVDSSHADLQGQLVAGWNIYDNNPDTSDVNAHGTWVSGVVSALSNNNTGVTSVAWNARVMPVRISRLDGTAFTSDIAKGITYAADNGANIANISYGASGSFSVRSAADYMRSKGGLVFMSAGNSGFESSTSPHPAIITVSATTSNDTLASWSTYGNFIDIAAPGSSIWTTKRGGGYQAVSGTSFSSPITAAVAALVMAGNPALSPSEVETILINTSEDLGSPGQDIYFGHGRINAAAAVAAAVADTGSDPTPDTQSPTVSISNPPNGAVITGTVTVSINADDDTGVDRVELYAGNTLIGTSTSIAWDTTTQTNGSVELLALAYDAAGNQGISQTVTVSIDNQAPVVDTESPSIDILSPSAAVTVSGKVKIEISASDNIGVVQVECFIDGILKGAASGDYLSYTWNTRKVADGPHIITAVAFDAAGNATTMDLTVTKGSGGDSAGDTGGGSKGWGKGGKNK